MSRADPYETWRAGRSDVQVDEQFADRVMDSLRTSGRPRSGAQGPPRRGFRFASHPVAAAALFAAGLIVGLLQVGSLTAFILFFSSEGF